MHDYLIIGAGSAGCVLANRLSAGGARVLLLEAGGRDWHPLIHMPAGIARLVGNARVDWQYYTEPEPELGMRRLYWPRGRVLGGSSSINAMAYVRGHPGDYDEWAELGARGWDYESVLPYFLRAEDQARGRSARHGTGGPLHVEDLRYRNPLSAVFVEAGVEAGWPRNDDFNGASNEGFGFYQVTQRAGRRCSTAVGYLRPALERPNLEVRTHARALGIEFEGDRATGVLVAEGGATRRLPASREVIVAAGAVASPQLLLLSGVGPAAELERHGIAVHADLPGVGRNLQDHLDFCTLQRCTRGVTYDFGLAGEAWVGLRYAFTHSGPGASSVAEAGGFVRSSLAPDARPDVQFHFVPAQLDDHGRNRLPGHGYTVHSCVLRPRSRGAITLRSARPEDPPRISAGYLSAPEDLPALIESIRLARRILGGRAFAAWRGEEIFPGPAARTDAQIAAVVRRKAETIYHPVGTCRMGEDPLAVTDPSLRVRGLRNLRVVDASVMPRIVGGNTNAPTIMIAERAAELMLAE